MFGEQADRRIGTGSGGLLAGCLIVAILYFAKDVFIPLALAGLVAFLLAPVATRLERWGLQRTLSVLLVIGLSFASVSAICWVVLGQVYNLAVELPQYQENVTAKIESLHLHTTGKLTSTVQMLSEASRQISSGSPQVHVAAPTVLPSRRGRAAATQPALGSDASRKTSEPINVRVEEPDTSLFTVAGRDLHPLLHVLTTAFIVVVFVIFMLLARDDIRDRAVRLVGSSRIHITTVAMTDAGARVSRYLLMQFLVNISYGIVVGVALRAIGIPHPLLWAVTTFLLRFIPYVGILAAGAGPVLIAVAVSPHWTAVAWTFGLYVAMELIFANAVEPYLYGSSTGLSALAVLVAAIFWTWLWGLPGLLLSTPLTVCLIVLGRHVPHMEFIGVLFGEDTALAPAERFYQRILAAASSDAAKLMNDQIQASSRQDVYDNMLIPALTLVEEARHSEEINAARGELALQSIEEIVEEQWSKSPEAAPTVARQHTVVCVPAKDLADEIACQLLMHVVADTYSVQPLSADLAIANILEAVADSQPDVVCVVGIPPQAMRQVRLRCHQLRARFPEMMTVACILSIECDLSNLRARIPLEDAQHVVCSLLQAKEYLTTLANPAAAVLPADAPITEADAPPPGEGQPPEDIKGLEVLDASREDIFDRITKSLAKSFDAPIAILSVDDGDQAFWTSQCGLPESEAETGPAIRALYLRSQPILQRDFMAVPDVAEDERFNRDPFFLEKGIHFYAGVPILSQDGEEIGSLCVLDTRPRQITEQQKEALISLADSVMNAIELRATAAGD